MPFCSRNISKFNKTLQILRMQVMLLKDIRTGRRASLCAFGKGSMTVEA